jgi:hypothetical protein
LQNGRADQLVFNRHSANQDRATLFADAPEFGDAVNVDQMFGLSKTKLHHGQQTVAASQQLGLGAQLAK